VDRRLAGEPLQGRGDVLQGKGVGQEAGEAAGWEGCVHEIWPQMWVMNRVASATAMSNTLLPDTLMQTKAERFARGAAA
jgi:hypothetical protein